MSYTIVPTDKPWRLDVWEPLNTKAPCPDKTQPYCCYIRTVIFYVKPYVVRPWHHYWIDPRGKRRAAKPGDGYEEWDRVEHQLGWDVTIEYNGEIFECGGGTVVWKNRRWYMKYWARRKQKRTAQIESPRGSSHEPPPTASPLSTSETDQISQPPR